MGQATSVNQILCGSAWKRVQERVELVQEVYHVTDLARVVVRGQRVHAATGTRPEKLLP